METSCSPDITNSSSCDTDKNPSTDKDPSTDKHCDYNCTSSCNKKRIKGYCLSDDCSEFIIWFVIIFVIIYILIYAISPEGLRQEGSYKLLTWSVFATALLITLVILFIIWLATRAYRIYC